MRALEQHEKADERCFLAAPVRGNDGILRRLKSEWPTGAEPSVAAIQSDAAIVTVNGNRLQANDHCGDGYYLTFTVVA